MTAPRALGSLLGLSLLAPLSPAQDYKAVQQISLLTDAPAGVGELVSGNFTDDGVPDAAAIQGGRVVVLYGGVQYRRRIGLVSDSLDLAVLPGTNSDHTDELICSGTYGVHRYRWVAAQEAFVLQNVLQATPMGPVAVAPDLAGTTWYVAALTPEGSRAYVHAFSSQGVYLGLVAMVALPSTATRVELMQHDGAGAPELVVNRASGVAVLDLFTGTPVDMDVRMYAGGALELDRLAVLRYPTMNHDSLVWIEGRAGDPQQLHVVDASPPEPILELGYHTPVALDVEDRNDDGLPDLVMSVAQSFRVLVYDNVFGYTGGAVTFSTEPESLVDMSVDVPTAGGNTGGVLLHDFDNDGDRDILLAESTVDTLVYWESSQVPDDPFTLVDGTLDFALFMSGFFTVFQLEYPDSLPADATAIEYRAWVRHEYGADLELLQGMPSSTPIEEAQGTLSASLYLPTTYGEEYGFLDIRPVRRVQGEAPIAYKAFLAAVTPIPDIWEDMVADGYERTVRAEYANEALLKLLPNVGSMLSWGIEALLGEKPLEGGIVVGVRDIPLD